MKKSLCLIIFLIIAQQSWAQNLDSLYNAYVKMKTESRITAPTVASGKSVKQKSGFGLAAQIRMNYNKFSASQKTVLSQLSTRPTTDTSFVTPLGHLRIHYDLKGANKPNYSINQFAAAADSAYEYEIGYLNFPPPPSDGTDGGDSLYDIYIQSISGEYGYTELGDMFINSASDSVYNAYSVVNNDFTGFYTTGINAAKVTVAHEFHHGVQVGNYGFRNGDLFFYEMTSTSMEHFVFGYIKDYIAYTSDYFDYPYHTFSWHTGYDLAIFNIYLSQKFGNGILKKTWEYIPKNKAIKAIDLALEDYNSTFLNALATFNAWTFFTGYRSIAGMYFEDARYYPVLRNFTSTSYTSSGKTLSLQTEPVSCNPLLFINSAGSTTDSICILLTNGDYKDGADSPSTLTASNYYMASSYQTGYKKINLNYYSKLESQYSSRLKDIAFVNNQISADTTISIIEISSPYPQPFNYSKHTSIVIPAPDGVSSEASLNIYTVSMKLVYSGSLQVRTTDRRFVRWPALDNSNSKLANGVYFYLIKRDDNILKGKIVIQND